MPKETIEQVKVFEGKRFGLLMLYPKPKDTNPHEPLVDLTAYGTTQIVDTGDFYALYFRGNGATG